MLLLYYNFCHNILKCSIATDLRGGKNDNFSILKLEIQSPENRISIKFSIRTIPDKYSTYIIHTYTNIYAEKIYCCSNFPQLNFVHHLSNKAKQVNIA